MSTLGSRNSQHVMSLTPDVKMARSVFDRSHTVKTTFNFDYLYPIFIDEILPGDTCNLRLNTFARLTPQIAPLMDNVYIDYFFFFVPNRLLWDSWEKFCGSQVNPGDSISYSIPTVTITGKMDNGSIYDHFGLPTDVTNAITGISALPLRAYYKIWNEWFRDENLQNSLTVSTSDSNNAEADFTLQKRGKRKDYFTGALTSLQKGTAISLPLGTSAPVLGIGKGTTAGWSAGPATMYESNGASAIYANYKQIADATNDFRFYVEESGTTGYPNIHADLSAATSATINDLRLAFQKQSILELDMRAGTRYVEILLAHFNVVSPDFRLQRSEYLGGGSAKINAHPVAQTAPTSGSNYFGQLGSFATSSGQGIGFSKSFVEHGYVIGLACARADITYQQGVNKLWLRSTRYDFFWPKLQELGEQAILNKEIYANGDANDALTFGYQERYAEYRYKPSEIHGQFRSTYTTPLDQWHMAEKFTSLPALNSTFIVQNTPITRNLATSTPDQILHDAWYQYKHVRPMMTYSVPLSLGRF